MALNHNSFWCELINMYFILFEWPLQMFGFCGKKLEFDNVDIDGEYEDLRDLFDKEPPNPLDVIKVNTFHPLFKK